MGIGSAVGTLDLLVRVVGDASSLDKTLGDAGGKAGGLGGALGKVGGMASTLLPVAGAALAVGAAITEMTMAAAADRDEQAKLEQAIISAGAATGDYTAKVDAAIAAGQERAFTDSQTREALQSLVTATGDVSLATDQLAIAQDVARFAGVDLATAADAVAKANAGQDGALRKLIPGLEAGATATDTIAAAQKAAAGQADTYAKSTQGQMDKTADAFGELGETIGTIFLPILDELLPILLEILVPIGKLVTALLPAFKVALNMAMVPLRIIIPIFTTVVGWIEKLVTWLMKAIDQLGKFLDSINPLKNVKLPDLPFLNGQAAPLPRAVAMAGGVGRAGGESFATSSGRGGITFNFYTTGDSIEQEQAVVRALRRVQRLNSGLVLPAAGRTA